MTSNAVKQKIINMPACTLETAIREPLFYAKYVNLNLPHNTVLPFESVNLLQYDLIRFSRLIDMWCLLYIWKWRKKTTARWTVIVQLQDVQARALVFSYFVVQLFNTVYTISSWWSPCLISVVQSCCISGNATGLTLFMSLYVIMDEGQEVFNHSHWSSVCDACVVV